MNPKKNTGKKKKFLNRATAFAILFGIVILFSVKMYQTFTVDLLMKDLLVLQKKKMNLEHETSRLEAEVSRLKNIDRINKIASEKLGLINNTEKLLVLQMSDVKDMQKLAKKYDSNLNKLNLAGVH